MRTIVTALTTAAACAGLSVLAQAATPDSGTPEARAYLNFQFGGNERASESFFYGLRLDHDRRLSDQTLPPLMSVEFDHAGFSSARINGMPFTQTLRLNQDGSGERQFTTVDWGLLIVGAAGLGFVIVEVANSEDESPDPPPSGTTTGDTTGGTTGAPLGGLLGGTTTGGTTGAPLGGLVGGLLGGGFRAEYGEEGLAAVERQRILDGGTGYMGDLIAEQ